MKSAAKLHKILQLAKKTFYMLSIIVVSYFPLTMVLYSVPFWVGMCTW